VNLVPERKEVIHAYGHKNVLAENRTTLEITKETHLTPRGDCIIAVAADKTLTDFDQQFKELLCKDNARLSILIEAGDESETVNALGDTHLTLVHPTDIVVRKSGYVCDRTLAIHADKAACDLSRRLAEKLTNAQQEVKITLTVKLSL